MTGSKREMDRLIGVDGDGWKRLERLYGDWLRALLIRRLRAPPAEVEDIVQDTWLRAASRQIGEVRHPKAFLMQVALNLFRDNKRREAVRRHHSRAVLGKDAGPAMPAGLLEQEAELELERIILDLPDTYRDAFLLSRFRSMSHADIAAHLGISVKTVEWRIGKALELCTARLRD